MCVCACLVLQIFTVALLGVLRLPPVLIGRKLWQSLAAFVHFHGTLGATTMDGDGNGGQRDNSSCGGGGSKFQSVKEEQKRRKK